MVSSKDHKTSLSYIIAKEKEHAEDKERLQGVLDEMKQKGFDVTCARYKGNKDVQVSIARVLKNASTSNDLRTATGDAYLATKVADLTGNVNPGIYKMMKNALDRVEGWNNGLTKMVQKYDSQFDSRQTRVNDATRVMGTNGSPWQYTHVKRKLAIAASIVGVVGGLFFLSANITGNTIADLNVSASNWIGGVLFIVGLFALFLYVNGRGKVDSVKNKSVGKKRKK
jgi:hypothetical protein